MNSPTQLSLGGALLAYLQSQAGKGQPLVQDELSRFRRWVGADKVISAIAPLDIEKYCEEKLDGVGDDRSDRLKVTKDFLRYLHKEGLTGTDLAPHAKLRRQGRRSVAGPQGKHQRQPTVNHLTPEGYKGHQEELATLKEQLPQLIEAIRLARATKDFSENSPLDAAREQREQVQARIREVEAILKGAVILDGVSQMQSNLQRVSVGSRFVLKDSATGAERSFMLVDSSETNPTLGKISDLSPIGKAVMNRTVGETVDVPAPKGTQRYTLAKIGA